MKRSFAFIIMSMLLLFSSGCDTQNYVASIPPATEKPLQQTNYEPTPTNEINSDIIGSWSIVSAKEVSTGEEYPLQTLYGTGIMYGGELVFHTDGTFSKYIGITDGESASNEGMYSMSNNDIILKFNNGRIEKAIYLPSNKEIEYHRTDEYLPSVYEYFEKTK